MHLSQKKIRRKIIWKIIITCMKTSFMLTEIFFFNFVEIALVQQIYSQVVVIE